MLTAILATIWFVPDRLCAQDDASSSIGSDQGSASSGKFSLGAKGLVNVNKFKSTDAAVGYGVGGFASYNIIEGFLSLNAEVLYLTYAGQLEPYSKTYSDPNSLFESIRYENRNVRFQAIEVPIFAAINLPLFNLKAYAGASYAYHLAVYEIADRTYTTVNGSDIDSHEFKNRAENVKSRYKEYNISALLGVSMDLDPIEISLRYQVGIPDISIYSEISDLEGVKGEFRSSTLTLSLNYKLKTF